VRLAVALHYRGLAGVVHLEWSDGDPQHAFVSIIAELVDEFGTGHALNHRASVLKERPDVLGFGADLSLMLKLH
jgi:hypothetical protein